MKIYKSRNFFYDNTAVLGIKAIFYILLGGRGCGKTYSTQNYCIKRWLKYKEPFAWLRLKEPSTQKLLANNAADFIDPQLLDKFGLDPELFKVKKNTVYYNDQEFARIMALSTFYQDKGVAMHNGKASLKTVALNPDDKMANSNLRKALKNYKTIVLDEMNAERSEKRTFDIVYALVNQLENICRTDTNKRIFMLGNTLEEGSDILANAFNFIPEKFGIYRLHRKHAVIHYIEDSDKYKEARKNSIAGILAPEESTFTNAVKSDLDLIATKPHDPRPSLIITFGNKRFLVYGMEVTSDKPPKKTNIPEISMIPYTVGLPYYKEKVNTIIEWSQKRMLTFDKLYTLKQFYKEIKLLKEK